MKKNTWIALGLIILVGAVFCFVRLHSAVPQGKLVTGNDKGTFSGKITDVNTACFYDATCSVTVDDKKVILVTGRMASTTTPPVGRLIGVESIGDLEKHIGEHANVYATSTPDGDYTIYGSSEYYVEVVNLKD